MMIDIYKYPVSAAPKCSPVYSHGGCVTSVDGNKIYFSIS
jgi:hypothetical protein